MPLRNQGSQLLHHSLPPPPIHLPWPHTQTQIDKLTHSHPLTRFSTRSIVLNALAPHRLGTMPVLLAPPITPVREEGEEEGEDEELGMKVCVYVWMGVFVCVDWWVGGWMGGGVGWGEGQRPEPAWQEGVVMMRRVGGAAALVGCLPTCAQPSFHA